MLNYNGLRKRPTYDSLVDYLEHHQEIITYPNRKATHIMNDNIFDDFTEEYDKQKQIGSMVITKTDKSTQTDLYTDSGMTVNLKNFREEYKAKLASGRWHLEGGSVANFRNWRNSTVKYKETQTMDLKVNRMYYAKKKVMNWLYSQTLASFRSKAKPLIISQNVIQPIGHPMYWWVPEPVIEPEPEIEPQFNPVWAALGIIGTIGDIFVPESYQAQSHVSVDSSQPITVNTSPAISVHSSPVISVPDSPVWGYGNSSSSYLHNQVIIPVDSSHINYQDILDQVNERLKDMEKGKGK